MNQKTSNNITPYLVIYAGISAAMLLIALVINVTKVDQWSELPLIPSLKPVIIMLIGLLGVLGAYNYYKKRERAYRMLVAFFVATSFGFAAFGIQFQAFTGLLIGFEWGNTQDLDFFLKYSVRGELAEIPKQIVSFSFNFVHIALIILFVKSYSHEK